MLHIYLNVFGGIVYDKMGDKNKNKSTIAATDRLKQIATHISTNTLHEHARAVATERKKQATDSKHSTTQKKQYSPTHQNITNGEFALLFELRSRQPHCIKYLSNATCLPIPICATLLSELYAIKFITKKHSPQGTAYSIAPHGLAAYNQHMLSTIPLSDIRKNSELSDRIDEPSCKTIKLTDERKEILDLLHRSEQPISVHSIMKNCDAIEIRIKDAITFLEEAELIKCNVSRSTNYYRITYKGERSRLTYVLSK